MNLQTEPLSFGELLSSLDIYDKSLCDLEFKEEEPKSAVAIIVKKNNQIKRGKESSEQDFVQDKILFLQRKKSPKDSFSGEICFPGGRQQPNQDLLTTAIRETFEQTNILLTRQNLVGCINRQVKFIFPSKAQLYDSQTDSNKKKKPQRQMVVYSFLFIVQSEFIEAQQIKLNQHEMETYQWVKVSQLSNPRNVCFLDYTHKISSLTKMYERYPSVKNNKAQALNCISRVFSPAFDINMNQKLYGITFYIYLILLTNSIAKIEKMLLQQQPKSKIYQLKQLYFNLKEIKAKSEAHVIFELQKPISQQFREFQTALIEGLYKMRPKL